MKIILHKQHGISLVEILVALVISLFLLGGIVQVYMGNKATYRFSDAASRIQENGRFALDIITTDIRMAGFWGCVNFQEDDNNPSIQNHLDIASGNYNPDIHDFIKNPAITANVEGLNGSDKLTLRGAKSGSNPLTIDLSTPGSGAISITANSLFTAGDIVLITNCYAADIFEASSVSADGTTITHTLGGSSTTPGNANLNDCNAGLHCLSAKDTKDTKNNAKPYETTNAAAFSLQAVTYSIKLSGSGSGEPALWRSVNNVDQELIEGIEKMKVLFGEDTDGDGTPNQYLTSDKVGNLSQVTAIRLWLVVRSENASVLDASQIYVINGVSETQKDTRLRHVFSSTITLRNKVN